MEKYYIVYSINSWDRQLVDTIHAQTKDEAVIVLNTMRKIFPCKSWYCNTSIGMCEHLEQLESIIDKF